MHNSTNSPWAKADCEVKKGNDGLLNLYWQRLNYPNTLVVSCRCRSVSRLEGRRLGFVTQALQSCISVSVFSQAPTGRRRVRQTDRDVFCYSESQNTFFFNSEPLHVIINHLDSTTGANIKDYWETRPSINTHLGFGQSSIFIVCMIVIVFVRQ